MLPATIDNQFSLERYWSQGDPVSHGVAWLLLLMSLASWYLILSKTWSAWRIRRSAGALDAFWDAPGIADAVATLKLADREGVYGPLAAQGAAYLAQAALDLLRHLAGQRSTTSHHGRTALAEGV